MRECFELKRKYLPWKYLLLISLFCVICAVLFFGCRNQKTEPVTLTMWRVYGSQTDSYMNDRIAEFNREAGKDKGITIEITSVSNSDSIHTALIASANDEPGAGKLPDMFVCYPKTAIAMDVDLLDWNTFFSDSEKEWYLPAFMEEGIIDGKLIVFPVAKSTETVFVNKTIFDRFSADTGFSLDNLTTWEGMFEACEKYFVWSGGKSFLFYDAPFNFFQFAVRQLGGEFFQGDRIDFDDPVVMKVWDLWATAAIRGHISLQEGFGTTPMMIGEIVCFIGSTASIAYVKDTVTYPDNTSEPLELVVLPYPVFQGAEKSAVQRGVGLCALKGDAGKEKAAAEFAQWFTEKSVNTDFCIEMGYMPVRKDAYEDLFEGGLDKIETPRQRSLYESIAIMSRDYALYAAPLFDSYGQLQNDFQGQMRALLTPYQQMGTADPAGAVTLSYAKLKEKFGNR